MFTLSGDNADPKTVSTVSVNIIGKQDQTLLWTCVAEAYRQCVNSRYAKFKLTGMKSD